MPASGAPIAFGTSGWRGIRGVDVTVDRVRAVARAVARWLGDGGRGGAVVVAHDTRPGGEDFAAAAAAVLRGAGFASVRPLDAVPTPVAVHGAVARRARATLVFTASHNPPEYAGLKIFGPGGDSLDTSQTRQIEAWIAGDAPLAPADVPGPDSREDFVEAYVGAVVSALGGPFAEPASIPIHYDAMHGAGAGVVEAVLARLGCRVRVRRGDARADFGGAAPEPSAARLRGLRDAIAAEAHGAFGLATDGDGDRFAVLDESGDCLSETEALALLVDHLARRGRLAKGIAISTATGTLVERVAGEHGLRVERRPIGFKHFAPALRRGEVSAAGDESGGFAWARFGADKDGILAAALFAEMASTTGRSIAERRRAIAARHGRWDCGRIAIPADPATRDALDRLRAEPPDAIGGARVAEVWAPTRAEGLRLAFDDGFLMWRTSGTEPLVRIYADAPDPDALSHRLAAGRALLTGSAAGPDPLDGSLAPR